MAGTAVFIYCLVQRDFSVLKRMHWLPGLAVFFAITAPWFYLVMKANPEFFERFFIYEHYTRFTTKDLGRYQPWYYFVPILLAGIRRHRAIVDGIRQTVAVVVLVDRRTCDGCLQFEL